MPSLNTACVFIVLLYMIPIIIPIINASRLIIFFIESLMYINKNNSWYYFLYFLHINHSVYFRFNSQQHNYLKFHHLDIYIYAFSASSTSISLAHQTLILLLNSVMNFVLQSSLQLKPKLLLHTLSIFLSFHRELFGLTTRQ